jgi:hypothetical protein
MKKTIQIVDLVPETRLTAAEERVVNLHVKSGVRAGAASRTSCSGCPRRADDCMQ